jgi:cell division protein FtsQ
MTRAAASGKTPPVPDTTPKSLMTQPRTVWAGAALVAGVVLWWALPHLLATLDYFHVQTVQLEGARFISPSSVVRALGADTSASVFTDPTLFAMKVEQNPLIARAEVRRKLPGTLIVKIVERTPVALIATREGFRGIDSLGRQLPIDPAQVVFDAPVVQPPLATRDSLADRKLYALLAAMQFRDPALFDAIEEVRRVSATEWQLRTAHQRVRVTPEVTLARLADIFPVEQDLARRRIRAAELDLRYRNLVIARLP